MVELRTRAGQKMQLKPQRLEIYNSWLSFVNFSEFVRESNRISLPFFSK